MSGCDVCIGGDFDEVFAEYSIIESKPARKNAKCCECQIVIPRGQLHEHVAGRFEYWGDADSQNHWMTYHTCNLCAEIRQVFSCGEPARLRDIVVRYGRVGLPAAYDCQSVFYGTVYSSETVRPGTLAAMETNSLKAPFPWFGGKSRVSDEVWERFGNVANYVEPFFGSGAVLLGRPHPPGIETVNDLDCMVANFWRALKTCTRRSRRTRR
jgi:hypothetical protein